MFNCTVNALLNNLPEIAEALEEIKQTSRAPEAKFEAGHLLTAIKDFKFILNLTIWANILREINRMNIEIRKEDPCPFRRLNGWCAQNFTKNETKSNGVLDKRSWRSS
ncbi:unnamed protein product [Danaus chrysippus]|uniref:(African queen) hypothetical protein n=1 Tax=Danaus chrysippus TaxID=151541 RepID=A0A8J2QZA5_9NEOP|nr:unnamed protein product [Danaus chrysippus]